MLVYSISLVSLAVFLCCWLSGRQSWLAAPVQNYLKLVQSTILPFMIVSICFSLLQVALAHASDQVLVSHKLLELQEFTQTLKRILGYIKTPAWLEISAVVLFVFVAWHSARQRFGGRQVGRLHGVVMKTCAKAKIYVTLFAAFTFFGNGVAGGLAQWEADLSKKGDELLGAYTEIAIEIEAVVIDTATQEWLKQEDIQSAIRLTSDLLLDNEKLSRQFDINKVKNWPRYFNTPDSIVAEGWTLKREKDADKFNRAPTRNHSTPRWIDVSASCADCTHVPHLSISEEYRRFLGNETAGAPDEFKVALEKSINLAYGESVGQVSEIVIAWTGLPAALANLLVGPLVHGPVKKALNQRANALFEAVVRNGKVGLLDEFRAMQASIREELRKLTSPDLFSAIRSYSDRVSATKQNILEAAARLSAARRAINIQASLQRKALAVQAAWSARRHFEHNEELSRIADQLIQNLPLHLERASDFESALRTMDGFAMFERSLAGNPTTRQVVDGVTDLSRAVDSDGTFERELEILLTRTIQSDRSREIVSDAVFSTYKRTRANATRSESESSFPKFFPDIEAGCDQTCREIALESVIIGTAVPERHWLRLYLMRIAQQGYGGRINKIATVETRYLFLRLCEIAFIETTSSISAQEIEVLGELVSKDVRERMQSIEAEKTRIERYQRELFGRRPGRR